MDTYLYLVLFAEFLKENTTPILIVFAAFIMFVGFVFGWFVGHLRNNQVLADMETALLKMENENRELKDYEAFYRHHIASALGSPLPKLSEDQIRRELAMQNVSGHGNNLNMLGAQNSQSATEYSSRLDYIKKQQGAL
jgi:hypothetical protein